MWGTQFECVCAVRLHEQICGSLEHQRIQHSRKERHMSYGVSVYCKISDVPEEPMMPCCTWLPLLVLLLSVLITVSTLDMVVLPFAAHEDHWRPPRR